MQRTLKSKPGLESPTALASNEIAGVHDTAVLLDYPHDACTCDYVRLYLHVSMECGPNLIVPRSYGCRLKMKTARQDFSIPPIAGGSV